MNTEPTEPEKTQTEKDAPEITTKDLDEVEQYFNLYGEVRFGFIRSLLSMARRTAEAEERAKAAEAEKDELKDWCREMAAADCTWQQRAETAEAERDALRAEVERLTRHIDTGGFLSAYAGSQAHLDTIAQNARPPDIGASVLPEEHELPEPEYKEIGHGEYQALGIVPPSQRCTSSADTSLLGKVCRDPVCPVHGVEAEN